MDNLEGRSAQLGKCENSQIPERLVGDRHGLAKGGFTGPTRPTGAYNSGVEKQAVCNKILSWEMMDIKC